MRRAALALTAATLVAACSPAGDDPGALSADEKHQLNDAAAMLDANSVALEQASDNASSDLSDGANQ